MDAKRFWIYISGCNNAAVLFDRNPEYGGKPLWLIRDGEEAQSAVGLHLGMLLQNLSGMPKIPPDFSCEGTKEDAARLIERDVAVGLFHSYLLYGVFDDDGTLSVGLMTEMLQEAESMIGEDGVLERIKELGFAPMMLHALEIDRGAEGLDKFRDRLKRAEVEKVEKLFFGE